MTWAVVLLTSLPDRSDFCPESRGSWIQILELDKIWMNMQYLLVPRGSWAWPKPAGSEIEFKQNLDLNSKSSFAFGPSSPPGSQSPLRELLQSPSKLDLSWALKSLMLNFCWSKSKSLACELEHLTMKIMEIAGCSDDEFPIATNPSKFKCFTDIEGLQTFKGSVELTLIDCSLVEPFHDFYQIVGNRENSKMSCDISSKFTNLMNYISMLPLQFKNWFQTPQSQKIYIANQRKIKSELPRGSTATNSTFHSKGLLVTQLTSVPNYGREQTTISWCTICYTKFIKNDHSRENNRREERNIIIRCLNSGPLFKRRSKILSGNKRRNQNR